MANRITNERFLKLSATYEAEQAALKQKAARLETELTEEKQVAANTDLFLAAVRSYTEIEALSPAILHEFIEKIVVTRRVNPATTGNRRWRSTTIP